MMTKIGKINTMVLMLVIVTAKIWPQNPLHDNILNQLNQYDNALHNAILNTTKNNLFCPNHKKENLCILSNKVLFLCRENEKLKTEIIYYKKRENEISDFYEIRDTSIFYYDISNFVDTGKVAMILVVQKLFKCLKQQELIYQVFETKRQIKSLQETSINWSNDQQIFIDKLIDEILKEILFLEIIETAYDELLKYRILKTDIIELKEVYINKIEQQFIDLKLKKYNY